MFSQKLSTHTTILGDVLTSTNQTVGTNAVSISAFSFADLLSNNFLKKNNLPPETSERIGYLIATKIFSNSLCIGLPKNNYNIQIEQIVFTSSSVIQYYKEINILLSFWSLYSSNFLNVITETIQGNKSQAYFEQTTDEFVKLLNTIQCFSKIIQLDTKSLPKDFGIIDVDSQITAFMEKSIHFLQEGDKLRAMKMQKMNSEQQESILFKELQELNESSLKYQKMFDDFQKQIKDHFLPLYNEQPYIEFQQYCSNFADAISSIVFLSYIIAESDPTQFLTVIQILQEIVDQTFTMISQYLCALRFRGDFNQYQAKIAHEKITKLIDQIFNIITGMINKCPEPLIEYYKEKIALIFTFIRNLNSEYNSNTEKLVTAMKSDPRFSVSAKEGKIEKTFEKAEIDKKINPIKNTPKFDVPEKIVNILFQLASSLLNENQVTYNDLIGEYNLLTDEFNKYSSFLMKFINDVSNIKDKASYLQYYNFTLSATTKFISEFRLFFDKKSHILRIRAGILCSFVLLSLYSLDSKIEKNGINDLKKILTKTFELIFTDLSELQKSLATISQSATELHRSDNDVIIYLSDNINGLLTKTQKTIQSNTNINDPNYIGNCIHLFDNLQYFLYSLSCFREVENKSISTYASVFKDVADSYRLLIQIQAINLINDFCSSMKYSIENTSNQITNTETLLQLINQIETELENKPPCSIFNYQFLVKNENIFKVIQTPTLDFIKHSPMNENIKNIISLLNSVFEIVNNIDYSNNSSVLPVLGSLFLIFKNESVQDTSKIVNALVSDHSQVSSCTLNFIGAANNIILLFDKTDNLKQISEQIKACYNKMIEDSCYISFGQSSYIQTLSATIKDLTSIIDQQDQVFQKYTEDLKIKSNSYCEKKSQNATNETIIEVNFDDKVENVSAVVDASEAVLKLLAELNKPTTQKEKEVRPSDTLNTTIHESTKKAQENLDSFVKILLLENSQPCQITSSLSEFHDSISNLIQEIDKLIDFSWNPIQQKNLSLTRENLIKLADTGNIVSRHSILKNNEWKSSVSSFNKELTDSINDAIRLSEDLFKDEKIDLLVVNETERELVNAAQFISKSIKRLNSISDDQKNIISGSNDSVGLNIIDITQPIFMNSAKIIEASRSKVKSILNSGNEIPTQNGFLQNTKSLMESLSLIVNIAESKSCSDPVVISEILDCIKNANMSIVHFLHEMKNIM